MYQKAEEDDRRKKSEDAIQRTIQNELIIHRSNEQVKRYEELEIHTNVIRSQEERRWKLMSAKNRAIMTALSDPRRPEKERACEMVGMRDNSVRSQMLFGRSKHHDSRDISRQVQSTRSNRMYDVDDLDDIETSSPSMKYFVMRSLCPNSNRTDCIDSGLSETGNNSTRTRSRYSSIHQRDSNLSSLSSLMDTVSDDDDDDDDETSNGDGDFNGQLEEIFLE